MYKSCQLTLKGKLAVGQLEVHVQFFSRTQILTPMIHDT